MNLSVIIPAYQTPPSLLKRCISSVLEQAASEDKIEIIVVDSSAKPAAPELSEFKDRVRFFLMEKQMYAGAARNFGATHATHSYIAFLDSDCVWNPGWLSTAKEVFKKFPDKKAFSGKILFEDPKSYWAFALHLMEFHEFFSSYAHKQRFLSSGNLLTTKDLFNQTGKFKEGWPACEDIGMLDKLGLSEQLYYIPELSITHAAHLTEKNALFRKARFMGYWRGFYDAHLPVEFRAQSKSYFGMTEAFLGILFYWLIFFRSLRMRSVYLKDVIVHAPRILVLTHIWARGFRAGLQDSKRS